MGTARLRRRARRKGPFLRCVAEAVRPERVWMDQRQAIAEERAKLAAAQTQDRSWNHFLEAHEGKSCQLTGLVLGHPEGVCSRACMGRKLGLRPVGSYQEVTVQSTVGHWHGRGGPKLVFVRGLRLASGVCWALAQSV